MFVENAPDVISVCVVRSALRVDINPRYMAAAGLLPTHRGLRPLLLVRRAA